MATTSLNTKIASLAAISKGIDLNTALNTASRGISIPLLMENPSPYTNTLAKKIKLQTFVGGNFASPEMIVEQYFIRPSFVGLVKCSGIQKNIWYLPLNNTYVIKFYAPDQYNAQYYNYVCAVPAKVDNNYLTGYKDYTTGVSQGWIDAFKQYASSLPINIIPSMLTAVPQVNATRTFSAAEATQEKTFTFNFWGSLSGAIGKSSSFAFKFIFYPGSIPTEPSVGVTTSITR